MTSWLLTAMLALSCGSSPMQYPVTGTVVEVRGNDVVVIDHDPIPGFMDAMIMPFHIDDPALLAGVDPGDLVRGTFVVGERSYLSSLQVTQEAPSPEQPAGHAAPPPERGKVVPVGQMFPTTPIMLASGRPLTIGEHTDAGGPVALTFIYTRCPVPEYCPTVVARFQALQEQLPEGARLLAVTMDPDYDTRSVLKAFAADSHARPGAWDFGRLPKEVLVGVAEKSGLTVHGRGLDIAHDLVLVILGPDGTVRARYHHFQWDLAEVVGHLTP